ncbi:response regulator [uncultured Jannaschia sp.]|uniref:response regulator n=1 Tax=uncultured Jannaschia sp. TaxID=293347 RepID=UPI0026033CA2|nr:response regulator [uncultured Jannaschia sp.]
MGIREKLHVMVVDDMSTSRGLLTQALDALGVWNYCEENDGKSAYQKLQQKPVHLVLSDYNMPGLDGLGLLEHLRRSPRTQKTAFILVTGSPTPDVVTRGKALRVNSILKKPFTPAQLRDCIEKVVGPL